MRAVMYTRISRDAADEGLGVDRQLKDTTALAERHGWEVVEVFTDNDISASTSSKKPRPGYEAMLATVRGGKAQVIVAYSNSRLTRRPRELEDLITLHQQTGVQIETVVSGYDDLSTADGRMVARMKANVDAAEAERTSERLKRQKADRAARGLPQGGRWRAFGYSRDFEVIEDEAVVVREIFERRASGQSATSIARELAQRGLTTAAENPWTQSAIAKIISRPGYCGLRQHNGHIVGPTSYPPLVTEILWRRANGEAAKTSPGTNARKHLLSGIAVCGRCSTRMTGSPTGYRCHQVHGGCGRIKVKANWLDSPVVSLVMARETAQEPISASVAPSVDLGPIDDQITAVRAAYAAEDLALVDMVPLLAGLRAKRRAAEQQLANETATLGMVGHFVVWNEWSDLDLSQKRALIGKHLDSIVIGPRQSKGPGRFEPERYLLRWRDGTVQQLRQADLDVLPIWRDEEAASVRFRPGEVLLASRGSQASGDLVRSNPEPDAVGLIGPIVLRMGGPSLG